MNNHARLLALLDDAFVLHVLVLRVVRLSEDWVPVASAYAIGSVAALWTIERVASFWV